MKSSTNRFVSNTVFAKVRGIIKGFWGGVNFVAKRSEGGKPLRAVERIRPSRGFRA